MSLTPAQISNVTFPRSTIGRRGYGEREVDDFLDEAARQLAELIEANDKLKQRLETSPPEGERQRTSPETDENLRLRRENIDLTSQVRRLEQRISTAAAETNSVGRTVALNDEEVHSILSTVEQAASEHLAEAGRRADKLRAEARAVAEELVRAASTKADSLKRSSEQRYQEAMDRLEIEQTALRQHIADLHCLEHDYRIRLQASIDVQLRYSEGQRRVTPSHTVASAEAGENTERRPAAIIRGS